MAARVPLPKVASLPAVVLFHREDPRDPTLVLQVPNEDRTDASTYMLSLENMGDVGWLEGLPNHKELRNLLDMEMHVAYDPKTGHLKAIDDLDAPTPVESFLKKAHREGAYQGNSILDQLWTRARLGRRAPVESPLRQALSDRRTPFGGLR